MLSFLLFLNLLSRNLTDLPILVIVFFVSEGFLGLLLVHLLIFIIPSTTFFKSLLVSTISFIWMLNCFHAPCNIWKSSVICCAKIGGFVWEIVVWYLIWDIGEILSVFLYVFIMVCSYVIWSVWQVSDGLFLNSLAIWLNSLHFLHVPK